MSPDVHTRVLRCLEEGWAALDILIDEYSDDLTPEQLTRVLRCRAVLGGLVIEMEDLRDAFGR
jgi:hypothetical protein